jgi:hypothetical protein
VNIPRHWASAETTAETPERRSLPLRCFGWDAGSMVEARRKAEAALARVVARVRAGEPFPDRYAYTDRPIREEILDELRDASGSVQAIVTRNGYGAAILNTARVMFVDIDDPEPSLASVLKRLFSRGGGAATSELPPAVTAFASANPSWSMRVYRTHSGWRLLVTHGEFDPTGKESDAALKALGADPAFVSLCRRQECFRARLTAKPWRCGIARPDRIYPRETEALETRHRQWLKGYEAASAKHATCHLIAELGTKRTCEAAAPIVEWHDRVSRATSTLPLA